MIRFNPCLTYRHIIVRKGLSSHFYNIYHMIWGSSLVRFGQFLRIRRHSSKALVRHSFIRIQWLVLDLYTGKLKNQVKSVIWKVGVVLVWCSQCDVGITGHIYFRVKRKKLFFFFLLSLRVKSVDNKKRKFLDINKKIFNIQRRLYTQF